MKERRFLNDVHRALRIIDARQLDDDSVVAGLLHQRLRDAELIDTSADDLERSIDCLALVGNDALGLVDFEREVHAALEIESALERHALDGVVRRRRRCA